MVLQWARRPAGQDPAPAAEDDPLLDIRLARTHTRKDGRVFFVVDDVLSRLGSSHSVQGGAAPPYWDGLRSDETFGEVEASAVPRGGGEGLSLEWVVDPDGALMVAFLEREANRASERRANKVTRSIWRAFPETRRVKDGDLSMIAKEDGLMQKGRAIEGEDAYDSDCVIVEPSERRGGDQSPRGAMRAASALPRSMDMPSDRKSELFPRSVMRAASALHRSGAEGQARANGSIVVTMHSGESCVPLSRLYELLDADDVWDSMVARTTKFGVMKARPYTYLRLLREHKPHVFKESYRNPYSAWLLSPEAALLVIGFELRAARASAHRAAKAREEIFSSFKSRDLDCLDLDKLAGDLGVHDSRVEYSTSDSEGGLSDVEDGNFGSLSFFPRPLKKSAGPCTPEVGGLSSGLLKKRHEAGRCVSSSDSSLTSDSEDDASGSEDGVHGASSSNTRPLEQRTGPSSAEDGGLPGGSFIVKKRCDGERCVHIAHLHEYINKRARTPGRKHFFFARRYAYLRSLLKHDDHVFKSHAKGTRATAWLASPKAALLIIHFELKANRASHEGADRAREKIFLAFKGKGLEDLNLDELARELEASSGEPDEASRPPSDDETIDTDSATIASSRWQESHSSGKHMREADGGVGEDLCAGVHESGTTSAAAGLDADESAQRLMEIERLKSELAAANIKKRETEEKLEIERLKRELAAANNKTRRTEEILERERNEKIEQMDRTEISDSE